MEDPDPRRDGGMQDAGAAAGVCKSCDSGLFSITHRRILVI
eukprot:COSAG02_NODE_296_length_25401_cov_7.672437_6_plen_41_part_00